MPPTTRKTTAAPKNGPAKKAAPKRVRKEPSEKAATARGIAAKRAQTRGEDGTTIDPYAPTTWGADESVGTLVDLELPSGQLVLAQRPGPEGLMVAGLLDDLDLLAGVLPRGGKGPTKKLDPQALARDPKSLGQAMVLMNRVTVHVVIKPELTPEPENPADKKPGHIYPSSVGMEDKVFLFNWAVGGTRDLAKFRQQFDESVADVASGEDVVDSSE